jgi:hypothetical protein
MASKPLIRLEKSRVLPHGPCHLHPPFGGQGMNMCLTDRVDLGCKVTPAPERRGDAQAIAQQVSAIVVANHAALGK